MLDSLDPRPRGVLFDYGNTLIPYGQRQRDAVGGALAEFVSAEIPGVEVPRAREALKAAWLELYRQRLDTQEESDPRDVLRLSFRALGAEADEADHVPRGIRVMHDSFVDSVVPGEGAEEVLRGVKDRGYRTGLLSNYSQGDAIRASLGNLGFDRWLDVVLVSSDMGLVKPHPEIFIEAARLMGLAPEEIVYVGDNPSADVVGASGVGMRTAHITQHLHGAFHFEDPDENAADVTPDLVLEHITDLLSEG